MNKEDAFEVSEVVNWLLETYESNQYRLSNLKLNKIVYFIHGVSLAREGVPLVRNRFECWEHGPVIASLYHRLKRFGERPVSEKITYHNYETDQIEEVKTDRVTERLSVTLREATRYFVEKEAGWLRNLSHEVGGPWDRVRADAQARSRSVLISDWIIQEHFVNKYGGQRVH